VRQERSTRKLPAGLVFKPLGDEALAQVDIHLPDLSGQPVHLADFRGKTMLVLFWRPSCGFCQRMLNDLKAWEANPPTNAPKLLMVSL